MLAKKILTLTKMSYILTNNHCISCTENINIYTRYEVSGLELCRDKSHLLIPELCHNRHINDRV